MSIILVVDAMSGDWGPTEIVPAALYAIKRNSNLNIILVGQEDVLLKILADNNAVLNNRISIKHAPKVIDMHDSLAKALRNKENSSMQIAIDLVKDNIGQACISAGNTGALMAMSKITLKMLPGVERPAICLALPVLNGSTYMLDLGANIDSTAEQLLQFAVMGTEMVSATRNVESPSVALLNIGTEAIKGNDCVKLAAKFFADSHLNFAGFVEGTDIYLGKFDVIVCDGLVGNIALKSSEGAVKFITQQLENAFHSSLYAKFAGLISMPIFKNFHREIDPRYYNGASLLGLRKIVVKSHGNADRIPFGYAIQRTVAEVEENIPQKICERLDKLTI